MRIVVPAPLSTVASTMVAPASAVVSLEGRTLGLLSNGWPSFRTMMGRFEQLATERYDAKRVVTALHPEDASPAPPDVIRKMFEADVVISGLGY